MAGRTTKQMLFWSLVTLELLVMAACGLAGAWMFRLFFPPCGQPPDDPNVIVIVSDCNRPFLFSTSPDGMYLAYSDKRGYWLRNLVTGEEQPLPAASRYWLTGTLILQTAGGGDHWQFWVYDVTDGTQTPLQWVYGKQNFLSVLPAFQEAEAVYYAPDARDNIAVALAVNFKALPQSNYVLTPPPIRQEGDEEAILALLQDSHIPYIEFREKYSFGDSPLPSHDGRLLAKGSRITDSAGNTVIQPREYLSPITGWAHDDSGVYFQPPLTSGPASVLMPLLVVPKDQPILKLKLPDQYLSPQALEAEKARRAQEQAKQQRATLIRWVVVGVLVLIAIGAVVLVNRWLFK